MVGLAFLEGYAGFHPCYPPNWGSRNSRIPSGSLWRMFHQNASFQTSSLDQISLKMKTNDIQDFLAFFCTILSPPSYYMAILVYNMGICLCMPASILRKALTQVPPVLVLLWPVQHIVPVNGNQLGSKRMDKYGKILANLHIYCINNVNLTFPCTHLDFCLKIFGHPKNKVVFFLILGFNTLRIPGNKPSLFWNWFGEKLIETTISA